MLLFLRDEKLCSAEVFGVTGLGGLAQQLSVAAFAELEPSHRCDQWLPYRFGNRAGSVEVDGRVDLRVHADVPFEMVHPQGELAYVTGLLRHGIRLSPVAVVRKYLMILVHTAVRGGGGIDWRAWGGLDRVLLVGGWG